MDLSTLPLPLRRLISEAAAVGRVSEDTARKSIALIDHTSLTGTESTADIEVHCRAAVAGHVAAVCVYPRMAKTARDALAGSNVKLAVVNNFPHGTAPAQVAAKDAADMAGIADEIDTTLDYAAFLSGNHATAREKLLAVGRACTDNGLALKTIVKASVYPDFQTLTGAAHLAIDCGANFVKTCTGKAPLPQYGATPDVSTLTTAAIVMQAVADSKRPGVGVKISGGVKTALDCEQMRFLVRHILGEDYFMPSLFRFGASGLLGVLKGGQAMAQTAY